MSSEQQHHYLNYVLQDVLGHIEGVLAKPMFGGYGLYRNGIIFGIIAYQQLYFKVDETSLPDYKRLGSEPFIYEAKGKKIALSYWLVPESVMEDPDHIEGWVEESLRISLTKKQNKLK